MFDYFEKLNKHILDNIKYKMPIVIGVITKVNDDRTYDVIISQSGKAIPNVDSLDYSTIFSVNEVVYVALGYGNRESPRIMGSAKQISQEPKQIEVDYSGEEAGGKQTHIITVATPLQPNAINCYGNAQDSNYNKCRNSIDGSDLEYFAVDNSEQVCIGQANFPPYTIFRGYLFFDTSLIPLNASVINGELQIFVTIFEVDTNFNIIVRDGQPIYPHNPVIASDYDYLKYHNNGGQINSSVISPFEYNTLVLNSNGCNWVNKSGYTKLCLISSADIAGIPPAIDEVNYIGIDQMENAAKLKITYEI